MTKSFPLKYGEKILCFLSRMGTSVVMKQKNFFWQKTRTFSIDSGSKLSHNLMVLVCINCCSFSRIISLQNTGRIPEYGRHHFSSRMCYFYFFPVHFHLVLFTPYSCVLFLELYNEPMSRHLLRYTSKVLRHHVQPFPQNFEPLLIVVVCDSC